MRNIYQIIEYNATLIGETLTQEELRTLNGSVQPTSTLNVLEQMACNMYCVDQVTRTRTHKYGTFDDRLTLDFKDGDLVEIYSACI